MRKLSTRFGVYAILLTIALYGALSALNSPERVASNAATMIQKATSSTEGKERTSSLSFYSSKNDGSIAISSALTRVCVKQTTVAIENTFFTHSATIQHYISTI